MINNGMANLFTETPFFNEKYIRSVNLKSIIGTISSKKELGAIKKSGKKEAYIFNKKGNLIIHYLSNNTKSKTDTVFTFYEYNKENKNSVMRVSDSYGFYSYTKNYDSTSRLVNQVYSREKNASKSKMNFKLEERYIIFEESYQYSFQDSVQIVTTLNSNGRPYKIEKKFYDMLGYLTKSTTKLLISNKTKYELYHYNDRGFLKSIQYFKEAIKLPIKEIKYDYDEWGNVTFMDEYKNNERIIHKELLYEPSTLILKTILSQDLVSNLITITKFKSKFYNKI
ncbi:MAG: hypothetical protein CND37_00090 [Bacteroidetes bacterium MED-G20]|nr:MAG: hypothetical protein CND37_00090 [Bacteroidetes bacterium MED-G20]